MRAIKLIAFCLAIFSIRLITIGDEDMPFHSFQNTRSLTEETLIITVLDYGATGDGITDDASAIEAAFTAAAGASVVFPQGTYKLSANVTVPVDVTAIFWTGAIVSVDNSFTFTVNGTLQAGLYQIFSGDGGVTLGDGSASEAHPEWWGAVHDGVTDDAAALGAAIKSVELDAPQNGGTVRLQAGVYYVATRINATYINLVGSGVNATFIYSDQAITILEINARYNSVRDLTIYSDGTAAIGLYLDNCYWIGNFSNIRIYGCVIGMKLRESRSLSIDGIRIYDCTTTGLYLTSHSNANSFGKVFINQEFVANGTGIGVHIDDSSEGNTFTMLDVSLMDRAIYIEGTSRGNKFLNMWLENNDNGIFLEKNCSDHVFILGGPGQVTDLDVVDPGGYWDDIHEEAVIIAGGTILRGSVFTNDEATGEMVFNAEFERFQSSSIVSGYEQSAAITVLKTGTGESDTEKFTGTYSAKITDATASEGYVGTGRIGIRAWKTYLVTFAYKHIADDGAFMQIKDQGGNIIVNDGTKTTASWTEYQYIVQPTGDTGLVLRVSYGAAGQGSGYVGKISCKEIQNIEQIGGASPEYVLWNNTHEDADGGRRSMARFKGEQSGGEVTTLATIEASHDGAADDQKGQIEISVNDGNDGDSPSKIGIKIINDGGVFMANMKSGATQIAAGAAAGELWHDTDDDTVKLGQ